ncbi:MAG: DUF4139 domain-containing protein [Candidatus Micrarchaeia archaeon]
MSRLTSAGRPALAAILLFSMLAMPYAASNITVPLSSVSLYSNGYGFFERAISTTLPEGTVDLQVMNFTQTAIPDSISISDSGGDLLSYRFFSRLANATESNSRLKTMFELFNSSIGANVAVDSTSGTIAGTLVWASPEAIGINTGNSVSVVTLDQVRQISMPSTSYTINDVKQVREYGLAFSELSKSSQHNIGVSYLAPSSWQANYKVYLTPGSDSGTTDLYGWSTITNNAGEDWKGVSMSVVIGSPKMASSYNPYYRAVDYFSNNKALGASEVAAPSVSPGYLVELISGQYKYTLETPVTLDNGDSASYPLFVKSMTYQREYLWDTNRGSQTEKVIRLKNNDASPLPSGVYRVYDGGVFAGEDAVDYVGRSAEAQVFYAYMPEVPVEKDTNSTTEQTNNARVTTYSVRLTATNNGESQINLKMRDYMNYGDKVEFVSGSPSPAIDGSQLTWRVDVPSGKNTTVAYTYKVTNYINKPITY